MSAPGDAMTRATRIQLFALAAVAVTLMVLGTASHPSSSTPPRQRVRLVPDTTFHDALADEYQRLLPDLQIELVPAVGSVQTVEAIERGDADVGFALADVAYFAYLDRAHRQASESSRLQGMAALAIAPMHLLARSGLKATTVHDLVGYRVGIGTALSGQSALQGLLFSAYGLEPQIVQPERLSDRVDLFTGGVDATFATAYYPASTVTAAMNKGARLVPIEGPVAIQIEQRYPFVRGVVIPAGTYPHQTVDVVTLGVQRVLIGSSRLDPQVAHELTRVFIETLPSLSSSIHTSVRLTNLERASATPIPLHPGAAQYYRERELTR
jgi:TRAP transporter TAXI family solute receptor